jgi:hypothetical protein
VDVLPAVNDGASRRFLMTKCLDRVLFLWTDCLDVMESEVERGSMWETQLMLTVGD